jgi:hypothetical protein
MSRNTKIVLIIIGIVVVLCVCIVVGLALAFRIAGRTIQQSIISDPTLSAAKAESIASFNIPYGYDQGVMSLFGFDMVVLSADNQPVIMMMQFPESANLDPKEMEKTMQQAIGQQFTQRGLTFSLVDQKQVSVKGQEVTLFISEGKDADGTPFREATTSFKGNNGTVLLTAMGDIRTWNQTAIEVFLKSIR